MAFDYTGLKSTAETLIARFGQSATLRQQAQSGTSYEPTLTNTDTTITVADFNHRVRDPGGELTGMTQRTLYISTAAGVTPAKGDKVQIGGAWHEIAEVRPLNPGGTALMYEADIVT